MTDAPRSRAEADHDDDEANTSDRSLLARFQRGQSDASTALYLRYAARLQALATAQRSPELARRVEPEDIVQSVFRTFFRRAARGEYEIPDGEDIWKLLLVIALNKVRTAAAYHRAARRDVRKTTEGPAFDNALAARSGDDASALNLLRMVVDEMLDQLPPTQRVMIEMRIEGHEMIEIAAKVARSKRTVERVLQDFRRRLEASLEPEA